MKKHLNAKAKGVLALTVVLAVVLALTGTAADAWPQRAVQAVMTPLRAGVTSLTRQAQKITSISSAMRPWRRKTKS